MIKILNIRASVSPRENIEEKINKVLDENDICESQIYNIQFIRSNEVAIFYNE
ncbi:hypothetical protein [Clostridium botulinum]|uniref:hypothetical protein n=1 Tax=Clostridium botulinum TaxID=1491 RepID=UPI00090C9F4E|nr:hypothetical protein [Clostridium botulinum]APH20901.1 hypothetical protein NPD1_4213 [Clostridium botulinum]APQ71297.1 hypothetical protein RSJ8_4170 [Clostridium botulinum]